MKTFEKYSVVLWDWNGTLLDDVWLAVEIMNKILYRRKLPTLTIERYKEIFDFPVIKYYSALGFDFEKDSFEILAREFIDEYNQRVLECKLFEPVREVLSRLQEKNISQFILSAYKEENLLQTVKEYKIEHFFNQIMGLNDHYAESKVCLAKSWIQEKKINPKQILFIGDTLHDYEVASSIGIECLIITKGHQSYDRLKNHRLNLIEKMEDLLK